MSLQRNRRIGMIIKLGALAVLAAAGVSTALVIGSGSGSAKLEQAKAQGEARSPAMLPARLLDCSLGRISNFDPDKDQKLSEYQFDEHHALKLYLPSIPVRTKEPPAATAAPEPVDPRTRIISDPDGITSKARELPFERVVDYWPKRVEMATPISNVAVNMIVIDQIDMNKRTAIMFVTKANDAITFDQKHLYIGQCKVMTGDEATTSADVESRRPTG